MSHIVTLHGGPLHGTIIELPDDIKHLHVAGIGDPDEILEVDEGTPLELTLRSGTYTPIHGVQDALEWDGWGT